MSKIATRLEKATLEQKAVDPEVHVLVARAVKALDALSSIGIEIQDYEVKGGRAYAAEIADDLTGERVWIRLGDLNI